MRLVPAVTSQNVYWFNFCVNRLWPFVSLRFLSKSLKLPVDWAEAFTFDCLTFIVAFLKFCLKSTLLWQKTTLPLIQKHFPMWLVHYVLEQIIISAWLRHVIQEKTEGKYLNSSAHGGRTFIHARPNPQDVSLERLAKMCLTQMFLVCE